MLNSFLHQFEKSDRDGGPIRSVMAGIADPVVDFGIGMKSDDMKDIFIHAPLFRWAQYEWNGSLAWGLWAPPTLTDNRPSQGESS